MLSPLLQEGTAVCDAVLQCLMPLTLCRGNFDVALALHACGNATDYCLLQAQRARAAFIVSPCCVGKLQFSSNVSAAALVERAARGRSVSGFTASQKPFEARSKAAGGAGEGVGLLLEHPRSRWMRTWVRRAAEFEVLARAADFSHVEGHSYAENAEFAKVLAAACFSADVMKGGDLARRSDVLHC
jgi:hypothetical protein